LKALAALRWSLRLDYELIVRVSDIPVLQKLAFILKKYGMFLINTLFGVKAVSSVTVFGLKYSFNEIYGLASLQRVYCASYGLKELLPEHPVVVDVGANIGQFTFFCRHYLQAQRVVSVEPIKECLGLLQANAEAPSDCYNCLVSNADGVKEFFRCSRSTQLSSSIRDGEESYAQGEFIASQRLADLVRRAGLERIDLLKVDTEGSEYDVLRSGEEVLEQVGMILVEMSVSRTAEGNIFKTGSFLNDRNFELVAVERWRGAMPKDIDAIFVRR
jgi:FkbM family methyltransferase